MATPLSSSVSKRKKKTKTEKKENHKHLITLQYAVQYLNLEYSIT
jgi:hypothetical protein